MSRPLELRAKFSIIPEPGMYPNPEQASGLFLPQSGTGIP
jgi:hypothetical protein